jgi:hypothetical protein
MNINKVSVVIIILVCISSAYAQDKDEDNIFSSGVEQVNTFQKLLEISPELVDEYVLLKTDATMLTKAINTAYTVHRSKVNQLSEYQDKVDNEYSHNEKFRLFRQIDNQNHRQRVFNTEYELKRARTKLYQILIRLVAIENSVETHYTANNSVDNKEIEQKLLLGEILVLNKSQEKIVLDLLVTSQNEPDKFVQLVSHPNVVNILPDYLKEQLIIFNESGITIEDALTNKGVMAAVINKIKAIDVLPQVVNDAFGLSIYSQEQAPKILDVVIAPVYLTTSLDADAIDPLTAVELYEIPLPSRELVIELAELRKKSLSK